MSKLRQECVLVVIDFARNHAPALVKVDDLTEGNCHAAPGRLERAERTVIRAFSSELGNHSVSGVNVSWILDPPIGECLRPRFDRDPELAVAAFRVNTAGVPWTSEDIGRMGSVS
jgi:hypothetical protein